MKLIDKCALVTGAASGLGRATTAVFLAAGAKVIMLDLSAEALTDAATEFGERVFIAVADVRKPEQIEAAMAHGCAKLGPLHIVVNCAGIPSSAKIVSRGQGHNLELWQRVIDINLTGTFNVTSLAASRMVANDPDEETGERGVIVNTASVAAFDGQRGQVAYAASKAAIAGMTLPIARDLAEDAIRCVAVAPGLFETELFQHISAKGVAALKSGLLFPDRMGQPGEFASFVRHVVENPYVNGACLRLDGGARLP